MMNERVKALVEQVSRKEPTKFYKQREWVGLTDEEISATEWRANETLDQYARHIEAKLREKNT